MRNRRDKVGRGRFRIIRALRRLARHLARRAGAGSHEDLLEDLFEAGALAFLEKSRTFDQTMGTTVWTYAFNKVRGAMLTELYQTLGAPITVSTRSQWRIRQIHKVEQRLTQALQREPTDAEIAWELRSAFWTLREARIDEAKAQGLTNNEITWKFLVPLELVQTVKALSIKTASLRAPLAGDGEEDAPKNLEEKLSEERPSLPSPHEWYTAVRLCFAVGALPDHEREVIEWHFGSEEMSVVEIGAELHLSRQTIHTRLKKGIKKLQVALDFGRLPAEPYRPTTSFGAVQKSTRRRLYREACEGARLWPDGKFTITPWLPLGTTRREIHDHGYPEGPIIEKPLPTDDELDLVRDRFFKPQ